MFTYFKIGGVLLILGSIYAGYYYVNSLTNQLVELNKANTKYQLIVEDLEFSMSGLKDDILTDRLRSERLDVEIKKNRKALSDFESNLSRHDIDKIMQRKPKMFEKIAQKGTDKYYKELEEISKWSEN